MNTWAPIFSKIVDSSVWLEPDYVVKVFMTMLAKKDADHVVRGSAFNIAQWAKKTEAETLEALKVLASPDTKRLEPQPFEGRRIQKVEEGWLILNGQHYENLMRKSNRRAYKTEWQREYRAELKADDVEVPKKRGGRRPGAGRRKRGDSGSVPTASERLREKLEREGDELGALRVEEMAAGVAPGSLGGYGPEAQAVVVAKQQPVQTAVGVPPEDDMPDPDAVPVPEV